MDQIKIGKFIAQLRKQHNYTHEQMSDKKFLKLAGK